MFSILISALTCIYVCVQRATSNSAAESHAVPQATLPCPTIQARQQQLRQQQLRQQQQQQPTRSGSMPSQTGRCRISKAPARHERNSAPVQTHTCAPHSGRELHHVNHAHQAVALKHAGTLSAPLLPAIAETPQQRESMPHSRASHGSISLQGLDGYCDVSLAQSEGRHSVTSTGRRHSSLSLIPCSGSGICSTPRLPGVAALHAECQAVPVFHVPGGSSRKRRRYEIASPGTVPMKYRSNTLSWPSFCSCGGASDACSKDCLQVIWGC